MIAGLFWWRSGWMWCTCRGWMGLTMGAVLALYDLDHPLSSVCEVRDDVSLSVVE